MKIGYPCINLTIGCTSSRTFRLKTYSEERLVQVVESNLRCLRKILLSNVRHNVLFFRITSDLIPFASHPICQFNWQEYFKEDFQEIGEIIKTNGLRISMHPDQFIVINALDRQIVANSLRELLYHAQVLDLLGIDNSAKIQIHMGGAYGDKERSKRRFIHTYNDLEEKIKTRLVIENDERTYSLKDCLEIHNQAGIPVVFDYFHHQINNSGEELEEAFGLFTKTWRKEDGLPMVDYSSQNPGQRRGNHAYSLDEKDFIQFLERTKPFDFDIMLEIKDKEQSALRAVAIASKDSRMERRQL